MGSYDDEKTVLGVTDAEAKFFNGVEGLRAHNMNMQSWVSPEKT